MLGPGVTTEMATGVASSSTKFGLTTSLILWSMLCSFLSLLQDLAAEVTRVECQIYSKPELVDRSGSSTRHLGHRHQLIYGKRVGTAIAPDGTSFLLDRL
jgi:hypothetical protein